MLADQFEGALDDPDTLSVPFIAEAYRYLKEEVTNAHRYSLEREAVMMVQNFANGRLSNLTKALHLCRLPAPVVWLEFPFSARTAWMNEASAHGFKISNELDANAPDRMGFLLTESTVEDSRFIVAQPTWIHHQSVVPKGCVPVMQIARKAVVIDVSPTPLRERPWVQKQLEVMLASPEARKRMGYPDIQDCHAWASLENRVNELIPIYMQEYWRRVEMLGPKALADNEKATRYDLAQEWRFILGYLILVNSRNIMKTGEAEDLTRLNRARAKRGKPPLLSHRPIRLALSKVQKNRIANGYAGARAQRSGEPFFVEGHFKTRRTGVFWWSLHERDAREGKTATPKPHQVGGGARGRPMRPAISATAPARPRSAIGATPARDVARALPQETAIGAL